MSVFKVFMLVKSADLVASLNWRKPTIIALICLTFMLTTLSFYISVLMTYSAHLFLYEVL